MQTQKLTILVMLYGLEILEFLEKATASVASNLTAIFRQTVSPLWHLRTFFMKAQADWVGLFMPKGAGEQE